MEQPVGELLRGWRHRRGLTQAGLADRAAVSARHVSSVETGRSVPSRPMVLRLSEHLGVPVHVRNQLLIAAGHAPIYPGRPAGDPELCRAYEALQQILRGHEPYPALALDRCWNLMLANDAVNVFLDDVAPALLKPPVNMMRLGLHPDGFASRVRNLGQVRAYLLPRLARQAARTGDPQLSALYEELLSYGVGGEQPGPPDPADIALPVRILHQGDELRFFSTITTFGAAFDIALDGVVVEAYFPADAETTRLLTRAG
ncbi:helix-turn-helix transcriptional regulator [Nonomuraea rhizosphaerae]|uniref:helix-turn-helix transcriptional regulator n=1 Tax=Nonomuraea rhizosphaerae TaxID=2665663 RepID=UPI001C5D5026|nr:helix-turn-helix transcriptional regulator [Nonomuraea rhizosphaerae]